MHDPHPRGPELGRGGRARHRLRSAHGLHRRRPDHPSRRAHGAARRSRHDAPDRRDPRARRGLRAGDVARAHGGEGPAWPRRGLRADRDQRRALATPGRRRARALALRGSGRRDRAAPPRGRPGSAGARSGGRHRGRAGRGQVAPDLRADPLPSRRGLAGPRGRRVIPRQGDQLPPRQHVAAELLQARRARHLRGHARDDQRAALGARREPVARRACLRGAPRCARRRTRGGKGSSLASAASTRSKPSGT